MKKLFQVIALLVLAALMWASAAAVAVIGRGLDNLSAPRRAHPQAGYFGPIDCPPFLNVGQNLVATANWNGLIGRTIDRIILQLGGAGNTKANHTQIKLTANEVDFWVDTGAMTDTRMKYRGITADANQLTIDFDEIRARTVVGQKVGALDTVSAGIRSLTAQVTLGAAAAAPTLTAYAMLSDAPQMNPYTKKLADYATLVPRVKTRTWNPGGAGEFAFPFAFPKQPGVYIKRIFLSGATVTDARIVKNGVTIWKASATRATFFQTEFGRTPQANVLCVDFIVDGNMSEMLAMENAQSLETYLTANGAGNIDIVTEYIAPINLA